MSGIGVMQVVNGLEVGGAQRVVVDLANLLDPGFRVVLCCLRSGGPMAHALTRQGVPVVVLGRRRGTDYTLPFRLAALARRHRITVLHSHDSSTFRPAALAARFARAPVFVHTEHGRDIPGHPLLSQRRLKLAIWRLMSRPADQMVAVSDPLRQLVSRELGLPADTIMTILNGTRVPEDESRVEKRRSRHARRAGPAGALIACVARLAPVKDHATLLRAMGDVVRQVPHATLVLVGDGPERSRVEEQVERWGLRDCVRVVGAVHDVPAWLAQADVFVLTSLYEGTSTAVLEAMASGLAVVATDVGGTPRLVQDGVTGLLVPPQAPSRVAAALVRLLTDPELRFTLGENACRLVRSTFNITDCVHAYERLYQTLLSARRGPPARRSWTEAIGPDR